MENETWMKDKIEIETDRKQLSTVDCQKSQH